MENKKGIRSIPGIEFWADPERRSMTREEMDRKVIECRERKNREERDLSERNLREGRTIWLT